MSARWRDWLGGTRAAVDEARWVVLDVETSGLDPTHDRLLAIAAVALRVDWPGKRLAIFPGDSFEAVLRQRQASAPDNILLHGIGAQRQREGVPAGQALLAFDAFAGSSPLLAFHAAFDRTLIERHRRCELGAAECASWRDVERMAARQRWIARA